MAWNGEPQCCKDIKGGIVAPETGRRVLGLRETGPCRTSDEMIRVKLPPEDFKS